MVVDSLFYGALRCTDVVFDGIVCFSVALYMVFVYRHLFGRGHVLLTLQLIFLLCFFIICAMLFVQLWLILMLFLLKILAWGLLLGKCLEI